MKNEDGHEKRKKMVNELRKVEVKLLDDLNKNRNVKNSEYNDFIEFF
jgi:hypothetical protein